MQRFEALKLIDVKTEGKIFHIENLSEKLNTNPDPSKR